MDKLAPFHYQFVRNGGSGMGAKHCTYCPHQAGENCAIACSSNYERIQKERAEDGVKINDEP